MSDARSIDEVIAALDGIIATAITERSRIGFFASLYRQVTLRVRQGIAAGLFDDGPRMEQLDVIFANRYLDALAAWQASAPPSKSWQLAFDAAHRTDLLIVQHLLLGINAHINLDLGIAAATVCPGDALPALHPDFDRINQILSALTDQVKRVLEEFSPMIKLLDEFAAAAEDDLVNFSMTTARDDAWEHAEVLARQPADQQRAMISIIDAKTTLLARLVAEPGRALTAVLDTVHLAESRDIPAIITELNAIVA
jgi:hypothetical protein